MDEHTLKNKVDAAFERLTKAKKTPDIIAAKTAYDNALAEYELFVNKGIAASPTSVKPLYEYEWQPTDDISDMPQYSMLAIQHRIQLLIIKAETAKGMDRIGVINQYKAEAKMYNTFAEFEAYDLNYIR